jgi:hypothetical protein
MNARTKTLFHFTKSLHVLTQILVEGFWPQYSLEDIEWLGIPNKTKLAWPMVSFCDIPFLRLGKHSQMYGNYGIGLCREDWSSAGLNPVFYISSESIVRDLFRELIIDADGNHNPRIRTASIIALGNCKPLKDKSSERDFYSECEWRFLPWVEAVGNENKYGFFMSEKIFLDSRMKAEANAERRNDRMLEVYPHDVRYLLVKTKTDVPLLVNFIDKKMVGYSQLELDLLKTRIIILDEISADL